MKGKEKKRNPFVRLFKIFFIILLLFIVLTAAAYKYLSMPTGEGMNKVEFEISKGDTIDKISTSLAKLNLIKNQYFFKLYVKLHNVDDRIKRGVYNLDDGMDVSQIVKQLVEGTPEETYKVLTIPEGYNIYQIAEIFERENITTAEKFIKLCYNKAILKKMKIPHNHCEGYLYPDTYHLSKSETAEQIIIRMINELYENFPPDASETKSRLKKLGLTYHQLLTIASLVETEAKIDEERDIIASVFYNRIEKKWRLQCDPTVRYALMQEGKWEGNFSRARGDLDIKSPYNTYLYRGLPPSPISNVGIKSIKASLYPADTEYFFFVVKDGKSHTFSKTKKQHQKAVKEYRKYLKSVREAQKEAQRKKTQD